MRFRKLPHDHLCSELVRITTPQGAQIANLEMIGSKHARLILDDPIKPGTPVVMSCLECPQGRNACTECVFKGRIESNFAPGTCGIETSMVLESRAWSPDEWCPRHLTNVEFTLLDASQQPEILRQRNAQRKPHIHFSTTYSEMENFPDSRQ